MPANPNWTRWIFASVATALKTVAVNNNIPVLVEGLDERTAAFERATDKAEIRITGPLAQMVSRDYYRIYVDANVLLTSRYDGQLKNAYTLYKNAGIFQQAMDTPIAVWNYGNEAGDYDQSDPSTQMFLGCLLTKCGNNDSVRVLHFGQVEKVDKVKQSVIDARYYLYLDFDG